jgi:uncharacterized protein (DUF1330 family)
LHYGRKLPLEGPFCYFRRPNQLGGSIDTAKTRSEMPAYLVADIDIHDAERYKAYVAHVPALIAKHGGRYRVRGGACRALEGDWAPSRLIVLEFPSRESALAFYEDPEYAPYKDLRRSSTATRLILADGYE